MNKRTFLKLCSAMIASPALSPLFAWASGGKLTNWAGNFEYSTENLYPAGSLEQVQEFVKKQSQSESPGHAALLQQHCRQQG